jgi:MFS family permease
MTVKHVSRGHICIATTCLGASLMSELDRFHNADGQPGHFASFLALLSSTLSAAIGRNGFFIASAWILVERGYGSAGVATLLAIVSLVEFLASPVAGIAADRFDRRRLNVAADVGRVVITLAAACTLLRADAFLVLCVSAGFFSLCDRVALTASQSMIPAIARGRHPATSNSIVFFTMQLGNLVAALIVGALLDGHFQSLPLCFLALCFFVSAGSVASVRLDAIGRDCDATNFSAARIGPNPHRLILIHALLYASAVLVSVMGASFVLQEHKGTAVDFGYLEAAWSAGSLTGAAALIQVHRAISGHTLHIALLGSTALVLMVLTWLSIPWAFISFAALGFFCNLGRVSVEVTLQSRVALNLLGRAKGQMHSVAVMLGLSMFGITAALGDRVFPSTVFFGFGMAVAGCILAMSANALISRRKDEA